jgi:hypothetical protein
MLALGNTTFQLFGISQKNGIRLQYIFPLIIPSFGVLPHTSKMTVHRNAVMWLLLEPVRCVSTQYVASYNIYITESKCAPLMARESRTL